jgi:hypothetical protein
VSVQGNHPDENVLLVMAKGMHDNVCSCGRFPCRRINFAYDPIPQARACLSALLRAGYEWQRLSTGQNEAER